MATLYKRKNTGNWWMKYQHKNKVYRESTKTSDKRTAKAYLQKRLQTLHENHTCENILAQLDNEIQKLDASVRDQTRMELSARLLKGLKHKLRIDKAWKAWEKSPKKRNPGKNTVEGYKGQWGRFEDWLLEIHPEIVFLHEVSAAIAEEYAGELWSSNVTPSTYNAHIGFIKALFGVLSVQASLLRNVWDDLPKMAKAQESRRHLKPAELKKVCGAAKGDLRYWFAVGLYTGLRLGDVVTLKWNEIDLESGVIERVPMKTRRKGKKVSFPIHPVLEAVLRELAERKGDKDEFLFPKATAMYERDRSAIGKRIQAHYEKCGITTTEKPTGSHRRNRIVRVGFHSLRHSFVSMCAANRVPRVAIMELVGHGSPAMTDLYSHAGSDAKAQAIAALPAIQFDEVDG